MKQSSSVTYISQSVLKALGRSFHISCASDEFYYFPQFSLEEPNWSNWDNFSPENIQEVAQKLSRWENELTQLSLDQSELQTSIDINMLRNCVKILREQLSVVRNWELQPTLYLSLACIGLAEAMDAENPIAKHERAKNLVHFIEQATSNLNRIPIIFRNLGFQMISSTQDFLISANKTLPELTPAIEALNNLRYKLERIPVYKNFSLTEGLFEHIVRYHLQCDMDLIEINDVLDQEIDRNLSILGWKLDNLPHDNIQYYTQSQFKMPTDRLIELYRFEIDRIIQHCIEQGLVSASLVASCPVRVTHMPPFLSAIHGAAVYTIPPRHPPREATFYIYYGNMKSKIWRRYSYEYKMTCAHETYPGHHLLDISRWGLASSLRRVIELPIFYEGWACFAEELLRITGYFSSLLDPLILARRRLVHAIRAKVDIGLQSGEMSIPIAAEFLSKTGIGRQRSLSLVRKYTLNPGYQLCYTLGLRRFFDLFTKYANNNIGSFVKSVLTQGEICFTDLEKVLSK